MPYMLIRVHSFMCDYPGCKAEEEHAEPDKRVASKIMRQYGWYVTPARILCPKHRED